MDVIPKGRSLYNNADKPKNANIIGKSTSKKITVFWDVAPCSLIEVYRRFIGACCLHHQGER
jgi:hypothetical protein